MTVLVERPGRQPLTDYHLRRALARTDWLIEARKDRGDGITFPVGRPRRATGALDARRTWRHVILTLAGAVPDRRLPADTADWIRTSFTHEDVTITIRPAVMPFLPLWGQEVVRAHVDQAARATLAPRRSR